MKGIFLAFLAIAVAVVAGFNTFAGTNIQRPVVYHHMAEYSSKAFRKRVENLYFQVPNNPQYFGKIIQGILAYDLKNSEASANITQGGIGMNFVNLRMKSERGKGLNYDVYIYV